MFWLSLVLDTTADILEDAAATLRTTAAVLLELAGGVAR
jgi:hypothetical protein